VSAVVAVARRDHDRERPPLAVAGQMKLGRQPSTVLAAWRSAIPCWPTTRRRARASWNPSSTSGTTTTWSTCS
jgi:hypothetical protein